MTNQPNTRPVPNGESAKITERQDQPEHLQKLLAYSRRYHVAQQWGTARAFGAFVLAAAGPVMSLLIPSTSELVAAVGAGWLVLGRTLLTWMEQRTTLDAARIQELYDTRLFHLPWNTGLVGRPPTPDDVAAAARHIKDDSRYRNWYSIDLGSTPWPGDVLLCQRQSAVWSRRDHRDYGTLVLIAGVGWFLIGLVIALVRDLSLADYLIKIFLPSAPAFLDSLDLARRHWHHANARQLLEAKIHDLWHAHTSSPASLTINECREIQDSAYFLRRDGPRVSNLIYELRRATSDAITKAGTDTLRAQIPNP